MEGLKLVTFDATNTLLKFKVPPWHYYGQIARDYGFTGTDEKLKTQMKQSFIDMSEKHPNFGKKDVKWKNWWKEVVSRTFSGQLPATADIDAIARKLIEDYKTPKCWNVAEESERLIRLLKHNGVKVGVISNFDPRLHEILHNLGLYDKLDLVVTSYDVGYSKPHKIIFEKALEASNTMAKPSKALHIGDNLLNDYKGAKNAGWNALLVVSVTDKSHRKNISPVNQEHVFSNLKELCLAIELNKIFL